MTSQAGGPRLVGRIVDPAVGEPGETEPVFRPAGEAEDVPSEQPGSASRVSDGPAPEIRRVALPPMELPVAAASQPVPFSAEPPAGSVAQLGSEQEDAGADFQDSADLPAPIARGGAMRERLLAKVREAAPERARELEAEPEFAGAGFDQIGRDVAPPSSPLDRELDDIALESVASRGAAAIVRSKPGVSPTWLAVFGGAFGVAVIASLVVVLINVAPRKLPGGVEPVVEAAASAGPVLSAEAEPVVPARVKIPGPWRIADDKDKPGLRVIEGEIGREPFLKAIQDAGLEKAQAYRALTALKDLRNLDKCARTDRFIALVERDSKRLKAFEYEVSKEEVYQAKEDASGLLRSSKLDLKVDRGQVKGAIMVSGAGFDTDAKRAGLEAGLGAVVAKALRGHMSIEQFKRGDILKVVAQEVTVLGDFARYAGVEGLEYLPGGNAEKALRVYYFRGARSKGYFDEKGRSPSEGGWRRPIPDAPITSRFNPNRMHPVLKRRMPHNGTDFGAPSGTPIGASSFGTVKFIGDGGAAGNLVMLKHDDDVETGYAHLSRFADGLKVGDRVERMQIIGYCGSTGRSTGPHLHFIAKRKGQYIDPETLNLDALRVLPSSERGAFEEFKRKFEALFAEIPTPAPIAAEEPAPAQAESPASDSDEDDMAAPSGASLPVADVAVKPGGARPEPGAPKGVDLSKQALHLSDEELLKAQGASGDGEVDE